jgi:hypothetical protein
MKFFYPLLCYYPSEVGGSANAIYWLNNTLGKHKFKSIVVSTVCGQSGEHFDKNRMFKVHNIPDFRRDFWMMSQNGVSIHYCPSPVV